MRKIRLDVDQLTVESFDTSDLDRKEAGTVHGHDPTPIPGCPSVESNCATCLEGCHQDTVTCFGSCRMTNGYQACIDPYC